MAAKPKADDVVKVFKGLAIAAARAKTMASEHGRETLRGSLSRHQQDAVRQSLLEIETNIATVLQIMTESRKS